MPSDLEIKLHHYAPNKDKPGYLKYNRTATPNQLAEAIDNVLDTITVEDSEYTLKEAYEWLSVDRDLDVEAPLTDKMPGDVFLQAMFRHGHCEGYLIEIILFDRHGNNYTTPFTIKFLTNEDDVWRGVRAISDAINLGLYN